jgi:hypothetical protein
MAKYSFVNLSFTVGGTEMKSYITTFGGVDLTAILEEITAMGDSWTAQVYCGLKQGSDITVGGVYDDTASTGPDAKFNTLGTTVAIVITWGGTKTTSFSAIVKGYKRASAKGQMTHFEAVLTPTGTITEA